MNGEATEPQSGERDGPVDRLKPGPKRKYLNSSERVEMLGLLSKGFGRQQACLRMGVPFSQLRNTIEKHPKFLADVRDATEASRQNVEKVIYDLAEVGDPDLLTVQVARIDKARQLAQARRDTLAAKGGQSSQAALAAVAMKVAQLFADHVPPEKLPVLLARMEQVISEAATGADKPARPAPA